MLFVADILWTEILIRSQLLFPNCRFLGVFTSCSHDNLFPHVWPNIQLMIYIIYVALKKQLANYFVSCVVQVIRISVSASAVTKHTNLSRWITLLRSRNFVQIFNVYVMMFHALEAVFFHLILLRRLNVDLRLQAFTLQTVEL